MKYLLLRTLFSAAVGLVIGCCTNTLEYRLRSELSVSDNSCYCPVCRHKLPLHDQIPVISYLLLGGRCRYCRAPISPRYPIVEASASMIYALAALVTAESAVGAVLIGCGAVVVYLASSVALRRVKPSALKLTGVLLTLLGLQIPIAFGLFLLNVALLN